MGQIKENYIDTGKVYFVFLNHPALGDQSKRGAEATECAAEQDAFWPFHDALFADQLANRSEITDDYLLAMADSLGLDRDALASCLADGRHRTFIAETGIKLEGAGIRGVPGFFINDAYVSGTRSYEDFAELLDNVLAE